MPPRTSTLLRRHVMQCYFRNYSTCLWPRVRYLYKLVFILNVIFIVYLLQNLSTIQIKFIIQNIFILKILSIKSWYQLICADTFYTFWIDSYGRQMCSLLKKEILRLHNRSNVYIALRSRELNDGVFWALTGNSTGTQLNFSLSRKILDDSWLRASASTCTASALPYISHVSHIKVISILNAYFVSCAFVHFYTHIYTYNWYSSQRRIIYILNYYSLFFYLHELDF